MATPSTVYLIDVLVLKRAAFGQVFHIRSVGQGTCLFASVLLYTLRYVVSSSDYISIIFRATTTPNSITSVEVEIEGVITHIMNAHNVADTCASP